MQIGILKRPLLEGTLEEVIDQLINIDKHIGISDLYFMGCGLTYIPKELESMLHIEYLVLERNQISKIEYLPPNLKVLNISGNRIHTIENLPPTISRLNIAVNELRKIENLPPSLQTLDIRYNYISKIENLSPSLQSLDISMNQISKMENLHNGLTTLYGHNNQLTKIENIPPSLESLYLLNNDIQSPPYELKEYRLLESVKYTFNCKKYGRRLLTRIQVRRLEKVTIELNYRPVKGFVYLNGLNEFKEYMEKANC